MVKEAKIYELWKRGGYKPYTKKQLLSLLKDAKKNMPYYVRIQRLVRDIPATEIKDGNSISNLREALQAKLKEIDNLVKNGMDW